MKTKEILKYFNKEKNKYSPISGEQIGQGGQGSIRLVQDNNGNKFALKVPNKSINKDKNEYLRAKQEVLTVSEINHKNIVNIIQFEEIVPSPDDLQKGLIAYLMPLYSSDLRKHLENLNTRPLHFSDPKYFLRIKCQLKIIRDVLEGLKYIHDKDIIHRDLKPENILIEDTGLAVITDFGISHFPGSNLTQKRIF
ncbi:protein kinase domain-containing protein [Rothia sp. 88186D007BW]